MGGAAGRYVVHDPVDGVQAARRALVERRVPGRQAIAFLEPEEADDAVHVQEEERLLRLIDHEKGVTNVRS